MQDRRRNLRDQRKRQRPVFRPQLLPAKPYGDWPILTLPMQDYVMELLLPLLEPIGKYRASQRKTEGASKAEDKVEYQPSLVLGLNAVTRYLERMIKSRALEQIQSAAPVQIIFACRGDLSESSNYIVEHVWTMAHQVDGICVIPLPAGAEKKLAQALGQRHILALGLREHEAFRELYEWIKTWWTLPSTHDDKQCGYQPAKLQQSPSAKGEKGNNTQSESVIEQSSRKKAKS